MPSESVEFLTLEEVLEIHATLIAEIGGSADIRDLGLLESALYRPRTGYYADLIEMAAALFESLLINRPFVRGNKQVAFFAADVFLRINHAKVALNANVAHKEIIYMIEQGKEYKVLFEAFLRKHVSTPT